MTKNGKTKNPKGERKERVRKPYPFDVEKARELRDLRYKDKENSVALMLKALIAANREEYDATAIFELANKNGAKLADVNVLPLGTLIRYGVLKTTTGRSGGEKIVAFAKDLKEAKPKKAAKPRAEKKAKPAGEKKPRKARFPKANGAAAEGLSASVEQHEPEVTSQDIPF